MKKEPKGAVTGFRFAKPMMELIVGFAETLGITRTKLVEESVMATATVVSLVGIVSASQRSTNWCAVTARTHRSRSGSSPAKTVRARRSC